MTRKRFLSMLVLLMAAVTGTWAQTSHWPDFDASKYAKCPYFVAGIKIDGVIVDTNYENWRWQPL